MNTKNSSSQNNSNTSTLEAAKHLIHQQNLLNQRIDFWKSLYDVSSPLFSALLDSEPKNAYTLPDGIQENDADRSELILLSNMLRHVKEFISNKIFYLERKSQLVQKIIDD